MKLFPNFTRHHLITHTYLFYEGDSTCGQRALYQLGLTGIPIYNVS